MSQDSGPQWHPPAGYPPPGYEPGHPQPGYPQSGYPQPGYAPPGYPPQLPQGYYASPQMMYGGYGPPASHSGPGVAAFIISMIVGAGELFLIVAAGVMEASTPGGIDENSAEAIGLGALILLGLVMALVGVALGIAGVVQRDRKRVFAVLGLVFNGGILLLVFGMMLLGLSMA